MVLTPASESPKCRILPSLDEVADGAGDVFDGDVGVDAVLVEEVDVVGAQPSERVVGDLSDAFGSAVGAVGRTSFGEAELGGDHDLVADRLECFADEAFVAALAIGLGGVEERDAAIVCLSEQCDGVGGLHRCAPGGVEAHAAVADGGDFEGGVVGAEVACCGQLVHLVPV